MMIMKFNKFERIAGLFVVFAFLGSIATGVIVALERGWLSPKEHYTTTFINADGVHTGTTVQIQGIKVGSVDDVELMADNKIHITFSVNKKFGDRVRADSRAQLIRPFIIGDRVLDVSVSNSQDEPKIVSYGLIPAIETMDLMTIFSGKNLNQHLSEMAGLVDSIKSLVSAFTDKERSQKFIDIFDNILPLITKLSVLSDEVIKLSQQATHRENLRHVLQNVNVLTNEINGIIPFVKEKAPAISKTLTQMITNLAQLTEDFRLLTPTIVEIAPTLPKTTHRAIEALNEAVVLIKAMQKSMFMEGNVRDVRIEESIAEKEKAKAKTNSEDSENAELENRIPAQDN